MEKNLKSRCLFCNGDLVISNLYCHGCGTKIESELPIPRYFRLGRDLQDFVLVFLRCRGNIREVEKALGISYPTVCKRLDLVNELLSNVSTAAASASEPEPELESDSDPAMGNAGRTRVLEDLEQGKISASEAAQRLRAMKNP